VSSQRVSEADWAAVVSLLHGARQVCLAAHVNPDGDSLGSALALGLALRRMGKRALVSFGDDPPRVPASLRFLPGQELLVPPGEVPAAPEVLVVLDTASRDRLGLLAGRLDAANAVVVIDHHASNQHAVNAGSGAYHLIDVAAPATAVLVDLLIRRLGADLTPDIACALYAGVASDTGSFRYAATTPETHLLAARLLAAGVRQDVVGRYLWDSAPFGYLKLLAAALDRVRLEPDAVGGLGLVWTVVSRADRQRYGLPPDAAEGVIDVVRKADEAEVAAVVREDDNGVYQVSVRSHGRVDVGAVCSQLGGGGHRFAAGFTARDGVAGAMAGLRRSLAAAPHLGS
jgi:phosphoesterase RecJ-like protein